MSEDFIQYVDLRRWPAEERFGFSFDGILDPVVAVDQGSSWGGTGRFEGASGSANFLVSINPVTGGFELTVVGKIDY